MINRFSASPLSEELQQKPGEGHRGRQIQDQDTPIRERPLLAPDQAQTWSVNLASEQKPKKTYPQTEWQDRFGFKHESQFTSEKSDRQTC